MRFSERALAGWLIFSCLTLSTLTGCGSAGTPGTTGANPTTNSRAERLTDGNTKAEGQVGKFGLFLQASGASPYPHIWATILKVELVDVQEKPVTVYESTEGFTVDLRHLAQEKRLALLTAAPAPAGKSYLRARLTFARALQLFETGSNVAKTVPFADSVAMDERERPLLSFPLNRPRDLGTGKENLVMEFELDKLVIAEGRAIPKIKEGDAGAASDLSRQEAGLFVGTVSDVATDDKGATFTLTLSENRSVTVQTSHGTAFYNDGPIPSPSLVTGKRVAIRGPLAADSGRVLATEVTVYGEGKEDASAGLSLVRGMVASVDDKTGTVALRPTHVDALVPTLDAVTVLVAPDAVLRSPGGLLLKNEEFYAALARPGVLVRFAGSYEPVTGTLKATRAKLEEPVFSPSHEAEVLGLPAEVKADGKAFAIQGATEWQGIAWKEGKAVPVVTTAATAYQDDKGGFLATPTFYEAAAQGEHPVRVTGIYSEGKLTATRVTLMPPAPRKEAPTKEAPAADGETTAPTQADTEKPATPAGSEPAPQPESPEKP